MSESISEKRSVLYSIYLKYQDGRVRANNVDPDQMPLIQQFLVTSAGSKMDINTDPAISCYILPLQTV